MREAILKGVKENEAKMYQFLRDMIRIPSESCHEKVIVDRIKEEMKRLDYDEVVIDDMGNVLGRIGNGPMVIAMDGHIDTVGTGDISQWQFDPFDGDEDETAIYGRGASDQEGGFAALVYAGGLMKALNLLDGLTVWITGTVQEEDCDGLCWEHIIRSGRIKPELVVLSEPTALKVHRGHRGRMEIKISVKGVSSHGSAPDRGDNAIYKMAPILTELEALNHRLKDDDFLGKGTLTVSEIFFSSPSRCAVADGCSVSVDRRLTYGETKSSALTEIKELPAVIAVDAKVEMYSYDRPSYTGLNQTIDCYFPTWLLAENDPICRSVMKSYQDLYDDVPILDKWTFSTNGVSIMGRHHIPCIGFGPGHEEEAHAPNEKILKSELSRALGVYTIIPINYRKGR